MNTDLKKFALEKAVWTQNDFEQMGWHDCSIYGMTFLPVDDTDTTNLIFDIDYIFQWVHPSNPGQPFSFWVSPCTLIFHDTFALTMHLDKRGGATDMLEIADLDLIDKVEQEANKYIYEWTIELQEGRISFKSAGYTQIVRKPPIFPGQQYLTLAQRNGISFSETSCAA